MNNSKKRRQWQLPLFFWCFVLLLVSIIYFTSSGRFLFSSGSVISAKNQSQVLYDRTDSSGDSFGIELNSAEKEELVLLPGIGDQLAENILRYREEHGEFRNAEELIEVDGISESLYSKLMHYIYVEDRP